MSFSSEFALAVLHLVAPTPPGLGPCLKRGMTLWRIVGIVPVAFTILLTSRAGATEPAAIQFEDVSSATGITFEHTDGGYGAYYLVEVVASGMASFDYDLDGNIDLYFLNGAPLRGSPSSETPQNALHRNEGNLRFSQVTAQAGLGDEGFGLGVAVGDYDNDGWPDVYINNFGRNVLYRNNGDGTFSPLADPVLACGNKVGAGACMLDIDNDGDLDIYSANYVKFDYDMQPATDQKNRGRYGGPLQYPPEPDDLLRNNGDGSFSNISHESGVSAEAQWGMGVIAFDADSDGDLDIFVATDASRNLLWENDGHGRFSEIGLFAGVAFDYQGSPQGSMGCDVADFNGDLKLDLFVTAFENELATLYQNLGNAFFQDMTLRTGAGSGTYQHVNWGTAFADFDNDGDKDLYLVNGHIHDHLGLDKAANQLYENVEGKRFVDISKNAGSGLASEQRSRAAIVEDLDRDGRLDIAVLNARAAPNVIRNVTPGSNKWLIVEMVGIDCNRSAIGSKVSVTCGTRTQVLEVHSGRGYQSHFGSQLHFGLGGASVVDQLRIRWPDGSEDVFEDVAGSQVVLARQAMDLVTREPLR